MCELDLEHCRLDTIEAAVNALDLVNILLQGSMRSEKAGSPSQFIVVGYDGPAVAISAQILTWIEAESPGDAERSGRENSGSGRYNPGKH